MEICNFRKIDMTQLTLMALLAWDKNVGVDEWMGHTPQTVMTTRAPANSKMLKSKNEFTILNCSKFEDFMVVVPLAWRSQQNTPKSNKSLNFC